MRRRILSAVSLLLVTAGIGLVLFVRSGPELPPDTNAILDEVLAAEPPELVAGVTGTARSGDIDRSGDSGAWTGTDFRDVSFTLIGTVATESLEKVLTSGPDIDSDSEIDIVVEVGQLQATEYDFEISYTNSGGPDVLVVDTVPAEWVVKNVAGVPISDGSSAGEQSDGNGGFVEVFKNGRGAKAKSSTRILWLPNSALPSSTIGVWSETRQSPGRGNVKFAPTSCGALFLNNGAAAFELDPTTGEPLVDPMTGETLPPILQSNALLLVAVEDLNGGGLVRDGSGDEDDDGLTDLEEVRDIGTDPCIADTDGDGVADGIDGFPLDPLVS